MMIKVIEQAARREAGKPRKVAQKIRPIVGFRKLLRIPGFKLI
jgi:hypothetical protein